MGYVLCLRLKNHLTASKIYQRALGFDIPDELTEYIPDFKYLLYDFSVNSDQKIVGEIDLKIFLMILRYIFTGKEKFKEEFKRILNLYEELHDRKTALEYFEVMIRYIMNAREGMSVEELVKIAKEVSSERGEEIMTIAEKLRKEGRTEGNKTLTYSRENLLFFISIKATDVLVKPE